MKTELAGSELRRAAFAAIRRELGAQALVRFIAENLSGNGDYTAERHANGQPSVDELAAEYEACAKQHT